MGGRQGEEQRGRGRLGGGNGEREEEGNEEGRQGGGNREGSGRPGGR